MSTRRLRREHGQRELVCPRQVVDRHPIWAEKKTRKTTLVFEIGSDEKCACHLPRLMISAKPANSLRCSPLVQQRFTLVPSPDTNRSCRLKQRELSVRSKRVWPVAGTKGQQPTPLALYVRLRCCTAHRRHRLVEPSVCGIEIAVVVAQNKTRATAASHPLKRPAICCESSKIEINEQNFRTHGRSWVFHIAASRVRSNPWLTPYIQ